MASGAPSPIDSNPSPPGSHTSPLPSRVAFQGALGAFSDEASRVLHGSAALLVPCRTFEDVAELIHRGDVEYGVLPVENTIAGPIHAARAVIDARALAIRAETVLPIRLCLLAPSGAALTSVRSVASHPVALRQCARTLRTLLPNAAVRDAYDTAGAASDVARGGDLSAAAVASAQAGERYGLIVLADGVEDVTGNATRFVSVVRPG